MQSIHLHTAIITCERFRVIIIQLPMKKDEKNTQRKENVLYNPAFMFTNEFNGHIF